MESNWNASDEWYWEGNIVKRVVSHLVQEGWHITNTANTFSRETGVDIEALRNGTRLLIEVKGYPSVFYTQGENKGRIKKTTPPTQARHWFAEVLFSAILRQTAHPSALVAIALPDNKCYASLAVRATVALKKLDITLYWVTESGEVRISDLK